MRLGRSRTVEPPSATAPQPGPHLLRDSGLFAPWYVACRLDEELERARRHEHPVALVVAVPQLLAGERLASVVRDSAAAAASRGARRYDLVGWLDDRRVIVVMPETHAVEAEAAAERIRLEMWRGSSGVGGQKWTVVTIGDARSFETAADLLESLRASGESDAA
jgi:hypothetical protein